MCQNTCRQVQKKSLRTPESDINVTQANDTNVNKTSLLS